MLKGKEMNFGLVRGFWKLELVGGMVEEQVQGWFGGCLDVVVVLVWEGQKS